MDSPTPPLTEPKRTFWQRRVLDPIVAQLKQGTTPEKLATTIAVGTALALFPILGTTTLLCFIAAWLMRLNQPLIHVINQGFFPIHVTAIYGCVHLGEWIFDSGPEAFSLQRMNDLIWSEPRLFFQEFGAVALHACVAWLILVPLYVPVVYFITLPLLRKIVRVRREAAENAKAL